ncbi:MAG: hypothetical protein FJ280_12550 [Planctomycetes bacterium]|nr:hypothetical protein [Planctomycetota bacterium]
MNIALLNQLREITEAFNRLGLRPVICGGLGLYLLFRDRPQAVRATQDIDLMITPSQAGQRATREAIARAILEELQYVTCEEGRCFRFMKVPARRLDILAPPVEAVAIEGGRVKLVRMRLHGRLTPEACFIEEDLRTIDLALLMPGSVPPGSLFVSVPSPANMLILKVFAYEDRDSDPRRDEERAQAHAYDIYLIATLAQLSDYQEGRGFLSRHASSDVIQKAREIVTTRFSALEQSGWKHVLASAAFHPGRPMGERREQLDLARRRLLRWFEEPRPVH